MPSRHRLPWQQLTVVGSRKLVPAWLQIGPLNVPEVMLEAGAGRADGCVVEVYLAMPFAAKHPRTKVLG